MRLLVVFSVTRDLDSMKGEEWADIHDNRIDVSLSKRILNCFDEAALETALCLKDAAENMECVACTVVNEEENIDDFVKNLYAVGFDSVVKILCPEPDLDFQPKIRAGLVSAYMRAYMQAEGPFDAVLTGGQSSFSDSKAFPMLVAEMAGTPHIGQVIDIAYSEAGLRVASQIDRAVKNQTVPGPCVYSFGNATHSYLRIATLREKMKAGKRSCEIFNIQSQDISRWRLPVLQKLYREQNLRAGRLIEGENPQEIARALFDQYGQDWGEEAT